MSNASYPPATPPENALSKSGVWVERHHFYGAADPEHHVLLVGFDTEFKAPNVPVTRADVKAGDAKFEVLSYQVWCRIYDPAGKAPDVEWGGVLYPKKGERIDSGALLRFAVECGIKDGAVSKFPTSVILVGHFTRADIPALSDFKKLTVFMDSVRNTFLTLKEKIWVSPLVDDPSLMLEVQLRDTMLLAPEGSKSLAAIGDLVGAPKIVLDPDPAKEQFFKENMDQLLADQPKLFETYALRDAQICVRYALMLLDLHKEVLGEAVLPVTMTGIGVNLLLKAWDAEQKDRFALLGKTVIKEKVYDPRKGRYRTKKTVVNQENVELHLRLATECYHGGRNEQFWFGPGFEDTWTDYDLSGAYPTAMSLIRTPDWENMTLSKVVADFTADVLGVALVDFEFPNSVRFPSLPVRSQGGLFFPRKGRSYCASPEIAVAAALGAKLSIQHGLIVPYKDDFRMYGSFIKYAIGRRNEHPKKSFMNLFWKENANATYGKTAQGLMEKRVYSMREHGTVPLPESAITNAYNAAYITSFPRALLAEILNALPEDVTVFSATTDGFLTNATEAQIDLAQQGPLATLFRESRGFLTGKAEVLETKHAIRRPLGWRTRGQATLVPGRSNYGEDYDYVLAKGGIKSPDGVDTTRQRNAHIVDLFMNRRPDSVINMSILTGLRDIVEYDADLVRKEADRRLSMEFDWKRRPSAAVDANTPRHLAFCTEPWDTIEQIDRVRELWERYNSDKRHCLKSVGDFQAFARFVLTHTTLDDARGRYLKKDAPDLSRLRQSLCSAWYSSAAGITLNGGGLSNSAFASVLTEVGLQASRYDVENGRSKPFIAHQCAGTEEVLAALKKLKLRWPELQPELFLASSDHVLDITRSSPLALRTVKRTQQLQLHKLSRI